MHAAARHVTASRPARGWTPVAGARYFGQLRAVLLLVMLLGAIWPPHVVSVIQAVQTPLFGTLETLPDRAATEAAAGVRLAELTLGWNVYEPEQGQFSTAYVAQRRAALDAFQHAGLQVVLGVALHYPPAWVFQYANSRFVNQYGGTAGEVNLVFNVALRHQAALFIDRLSKDFPLRQFAAIRVTSGGDPEAMYPEERADGVHADAYWAYDANAQGGGGRPDAIGPAPMPGWVPGQRTWQGHPVTAAMAGQWYAWYLGALDNEVNWQLQLYRSLGYTGSLQVLTPGVGTRPIQYAAAVAHDLADQYDSSATLGRGAVWDRFYEGLWQRRGVVAYVSSLADGSGGDDSCLPGDARADWATQAVANWSAARFISAVADRLGLGKAGENPGEGTTGYGSAMMVSAARQALSCGMSEEFWAHDANLYAGTGGLSLPAFARTITFIHALMLP